MMATLRLWAVTVGQERFLYLAADRPSAKRVAVTCGLKWARRGNTEIKPADDLDAALLTPDPEEFKGLVVFPITQAQERSAAKAEWDRRNRSAVERQARQVAKHFKAQQ